MLASETRQHAREALQGKWGKAALIVLVYTLLTAVINLVLNFIPVIGSIAQFVIELPLAFGFVATLIKLKRGEEIAYTDFITIGFNNFANTWKVTLWTAVKMLVPIIVLVVSIFVMCIGFGVSGAIFSAPSLLGDTSSSLTTASATAGGASAVIGMLGLIGYCVSLIWITIKSYLFKPTYFILFDNPTMEAKEIVEESIRIMTGNRWKWFCLELSFIGWAILACFTFGIGFLWLLPYMLVAEVVFYEFLSGKNTVTAEKVETEENTETEVIEEK